MKAQDLKKSILQLAIQGKLVAQDENDEPAEVLYAKIQAEKQKLIKEGKIKKDKTLPPITEDEIPFPIPPTWKWVRLEDIIFSVPTKNYQILQSQIKQRGIHPVVSQSLKLVEGYSDDSTKLFYHNIPVLIFGDHTKCLKLINFNFIVGADGVKILSPYWNYTNYLYYALSYFIINMKDRGYSRHYQFIKNKILPLPPLEEQKRIVAKIEELEPLINQYDQAEQELSTLNDKFPEQLKKSILQYAIQGKLVAQDENDEPAEVLYAKIQAEKQKLIKEGKIKKDKPLSPITEDEIPFPVPSTWKWVRLGDITCLKRGKSKHRPRNDPKLFGGNYPFIQTGDVAKAGKYITDFKTTYSDLGLLQSSMFYEGTLCITIAANIADVSILKINACFPDSIVGLSVYNNLCNIEFLYYFFCYVKNSLDAIAPSTAQKNINLEILNNLLIPLPPLEEQHRIVARVNDLLQQCDTMKQLSKKN